MRLSDTKIYRRWQSMIQRCRDPNSIRWPHYGGRGIKVCDRWHKFDNFIADMGIPKEGMQIDRIDNNGNYEPSNCRWTTLKENNRNKQNHAFITAFGETLPRSVWCERFQIPTCTLRDRIAGGWPAELALTMERMPHNLCRRYDE